jgi:hypothetical protein
MAPKVRLARQARKALLEWMAAMASRASLDRLA